ncbi:MAG: hypothetical protein KU29_07765 [Sulfurovum sp. FS06-10]|nr:MAG: hypothetical protein KU29_07765 [Sulfurovum sp. FS06-10]
MIDDLMQRILPITRSMNVLIVDDENPFREALTMVLKEFFAIVVESKNGRDAIANFINNPNFYDLIITDLQMPYLDGIHLIESILMYKPSQKIIIVTATKNEMAENIILEKFIFIQKPFTLESFMNALCALICVQEKSF